MGLLIVMPVQTTDLRFAFSFLT